MVKTFKKSISLFVALVFLLSLVPVAGMADVEGESSIGKAVIAFNDATRADYGHSYNKSTAQGNIYDNPNYLYVRTQYPGYVKFHLDGYEEILRNEGTSLVLNFSPRSSTYPVIDFRVLLANDDCDQVDFAELSYTKAVEIGYHDTDRPVIYTKSDGVSSTAVFSSGELDVDAFVSVLEEGTDNSSIALWLNALSTNSQMKPASSNLTITYDENEIDNEAYIASILDEITWESISNDQEDYVVNPVNLPKKYKGVNIVWESTNEDIINPSSGEVTQNPSAKTNVTLTANATYTNALGDTVTDTKSFDVVVPKLVVNFEVNYDGTKAIKTNASGPVQTIVDGFGGKSASDNVIRFTDNSTRYLNPDVSGARNFEVSVLIPENNGMLTFSVKAYTPTEAAGGSIEYAIMSDGFYLNYSDGPSKKMDLEPNQWHNIVIAAPEVLSVDSAGNPTETGTNFAIYVDDKLVEHRTLSAQNIYTKTTTDETTGITTTTVSTGINRIRMNGHATDPIYIDNMRWSTQSYEDFAAHNAMSNVTSSVYDINYDEKTISYKEPNTTVADFVANISVEDDTEVKVLRGTGVDGVMLEDTDIIADGDSAVLAARNGTNVERTYNYYTIKKIDSEIEVNTLVNGTSSTIYDDDDSLSVSVDFTNYTASKTYNVTMYTAQYQYGELVNLWQDSGSVAAGKSETFTCDFEGLKDRERSSIKVMLVDEDFNPYTKVSSMRFNNKDTEATLYLLGDSIVQTYVDAGYPIQGWGCYIPNYLNENITVENRATSGWTTDHYLYPDGIYTRTDGVTEYGTELLNSNGNKKTVGASNRHKIWANILSELEPGDYVMVSLGINDSGTGNVPADRYLENIETIYDQATAKGATVIFSTPTISGKDWNNTSFGESWGGRGQICADFAATNDAICLPLGATLVKTYNDMANEYLAQNPTKTKADANNYVRNYFHMYPASGGTLPDGTADFGSLTSDDSTHHNYIGSNKVAGIIAKLLLESDSPLADYVVLQ